MNVRAVDLTEGAGALLFSDTVNAMRVVSAADLAALSSTLSAYSFHARTLLRITIQKKRRQVCSRNSSFWSMEKRGLGSSEIQYGMLSSAKHTFSVSRERGLS